jgi:hypothetical protein
VPRMGLHSSRFAALVLCLAVKPTNAGLVFPSVVEHVNAARIDIAPAHSATGEGPARWRVEIADAELFGISGLRSSGVRASARYRALIINPVLVRVMSPVGAHDHATMEFGLAMSNAWQGAIRAGWERLTLDGTYAVSWRVMGMASRVDVGRVSVVADVNALEGQGRYDTSLSLSTKVRTGALHLVGTVRVDGDRFAGAAVSLTARIHSSLALLAGYDDATGSMRGGAVIQWGAIEIATGVSQHPVLGLSQGVSVACVR